MRILQIINSMSSGGAEKLLVDTCRKMASLGHTIDVFLLRSEETHLLAVIREMPGVNIITQAQYPGIYNPYWILKLRRHLRNHSYDAVQVHLFPAFYWSGLAGWLAGRKIRLFYTEHNTTNRRRKVALMKIADRFVYRRYHRIITISDAVDESLKHHLGDTRVPITKIYNGINLEEIKQALPYPPGFFKLPEDSRTLLQVSSFTPQKDQATLIRSLLHLPSKYHVFLIGDGPTRRACASQTKALNLENRVHFMGIRNDVPRLLKSADLVILASHFEGLSLSSVEGLASGKPFLASDVPGLREVVTGAGVLFPDGDEKALTNMILKLETDHGLRNEIVKNCVERAEKFNISTMVEAYLDIYYRESNKNNKQKSQISL